MCFQRIQGAGLSLNSPKSAIAKKETEYLGYVVGNCGISPHIQKIKAIQTVLSTTQDPRFNHS